MLKKLAEDNNFPDKKLLETICKDIRSGAVIGCKGPFRNPSRATNAPSALENGEKVTDAIADWVKKGFAFGPVHEDNVPSSAKFSGIMTRPKPSGAVRIIINLSSPKGSSVNEGINPEDFPTKMSSTTIWLRALNKAGKNCFITKCDWSDAYKHVPTCLEDSNLQWFSWLGMCFKELCLVFGGCSSAGIFDRLAKLVLFIVLKRSGFDKDLVVQHLDDVCACNSSKEKLEFFDEEFTKVAELLGVNLAPRSDPEKSFAPCTRGTVLGIVYDTVAWTWTLPAEKLIRLLHDLHSILNKSEVPQELLWKVVGKILHILPLIPAGKFNIYHLLRANAFSTEPKTLVPISHLCKEQVWFWLTMIKTCCGRVSIPDPDLHLPAWAVDVYTDAAGGSPDASDRGVGAVCPNWWVQLPWGAAINTGRSTEEGRQLDRVMSALELVGPLLALSSAAHLLKNRPVRFWVDNAGSVFIFKKGYSTSCPLSAAIVSAIAKVAAGIGSRVDLVKITRCSTPLASMADALSKGEFGRFRAWQVSSFAKTLPFAPLEVSPALLRWVARPTADWQLGDKILAELSGRGLTLRPLF